MPITVTTRRGPRSAAEWWWPLHRHGRRLLLGAIPVTTVAALLLVLIDPVFMSHAVVEVTGPDLDSSMPQAGNAHALRVLMGTQREIASSSTVAGALRHNLVVEAVPDTHLLAIHYQAPDPVVARDGANTVAQAYVDYTAGRQLTAIESAASLMVQKLEGVKNAANIAHSIQNRETPQNTDRAQNGDRLQSPFQNTLQPRSDLLDMIPPIYPGSRELEKLPRPELAGGELVSSLVETTLLRQVVESYDASVTRMISARIMDPASLPLEPVARHYSVWILLSYLSAVLVPALVLVVRFQWRNTIDLPQDVGRSLGVQCLGTVPLLERMPEDGCSSQATFTAALRKLSTELRLLRPSRSPLEQFPRGRIVLVTSATTGEGKSTLASSLAASLGRLEKVLLIDADMRSARTCFGIKASAAGLSHLIAGAAQMRDCIHHVADKNIDVIPTGVLPPNPQELLASKRLQRVLDMLERRYDAIIIDSPAVGEVSDTLSLARRYSDLLYVVTAGETRVDDARTQLARLQASGAPMAGVIINRFSIAANVSAAADSHANGVLHESR